MEQDDIRVIRAALTLANSTAAQHRYGGMHRLYEAIQEARQALDRIEARHYGRQLGLFDGSVVIVGDSLGDTP